ncbi:MAG: LCP family protein, partial [Brachybacterium sp.]
PDRLYSFLDATTSALTVDPGLSGIADMAALGSRVSRVPTEDISFLTMPWQAAPGDANRVVPSAEAEAVFEHLRRDVPLLSSGGDDGSAADDGGDTEGADGAGSTVPAATASPTGSPAGPQEPSDVTPIETAARSADTDLCAS